MKRLKNVSIIIGVLLGLVTLSSVAFHAINFYLFSSVKIDSNEHSIKDMSTEINKISGSVNETNTNLVYFMGQMGVRPLVSKIDFKVTKQ